VGLHETNDLVRVLNRSASAYFAFGNQTAPRQLPALPSLRTCVGTGIRKMVNKTARE
jgi:hypothetical protein